MFADIDNLKVGITFHLLLYILAVRASMHTYILIMAFN